MKHTEEITGKLKGDDAGGATRAVDERWGKNRVYAGRSDSTHDTLQIASGPKIEVTAFKHLLQQLPVSSSTRRTATRKSVVLFFADRLEIEPPRQLVERRQIGR